jgi:hypothetical protein
MEKRRNVIVGLTALSWLAIACSSGSGALFTGEDGNDRPTINRESPGSGRESPLTTNEAPPPGRETPPPSGDNPGAQGGGGSGVNTCPPCDTRFDCTAGGERSDLTLQTVNGECSAGDGITFDCAGNVFENGVAIGTWTLAGDAFTVNVTSAIQSMSYVCTKLPNRPKPAGTATGAGTAPPSTVPPTPLDAGSNG